jgi:hypothetical protein
MDEGPLLNHQRFFRSVIICDINKNHLRHLRRIFCSVFLEWFRMKKTFITLNNLRKGPFIELSARARVARHGLKLRHSSVQMSFTLRFLTFKHAKCISCFHRNEPFGHEVDAKKRDPKCLVEKWHSERHETLSIIYTVYKE